MANKYKIKNTGEIIVESTNSIRTLRVVDARKISNTVEQVMPSASQMRAGEGSFQPSHNEVQAATKNAIPEFLLRMFSTLKVQAGLVFGGLGAVLVFSISAVLYAFFNNAGWGFYLIPGILIMFSSFKIISKLTTINKTKREILTYQRNSYDGIYKIPLFVKGIYRRTNAKLSRQNWVFASLYLAIGAYMLYTVAFSYIRSPYFNIGQLIDDMYGGPEAVRTIMLFTFYSLVALIIYHVISMVLSKRMIYRIDVNYGYQIIDTHEQSVIRTKARRWPRVFFWVTLLVVLIIPIILLLSKGNRDKFSKHLDTAAKVSSIVKSNNGGAA